MVLLVDVSINPHSNCVVLALFGHIKVYCMIICRKFVALKKLDGCLIKLQHHYFMQQIQTLYVLLRHHNPIGQLCYTRNFRFSAHKEGSQSLLAIANVLHLNFI